MIEQIDPAVDAALIAHQNSQATQAGSDELDVLHEAHQANRQSQADEDARRTDEILSVKNRTPEDLQADSDFSPTGFFNKHGSNLPADVIDKLSVVLDNRKKSDLTKKQAWEATKKAPGGVWDFVKGLGTIARETASFLPAVAGAGLGSASAGDDPGVGMKKVALEKFANMRAGEELMGTALAGGIRNAVRTGANNLVANSDANKETLAKLLNSPAGADIKRQREFEGTPIPKPTGPIQADIMDPANFSKPADRLQALFADSAMEQQIGKVAEGRGALAEQDGLDTDTLAKEGIQLDPEIIAAWSKADPTLLMGTMVGLRVARAANGAHVVVNQAGKTIATTTTERAAKAVLQRLHATTKAAVQGTAGLVERGANAANRGIVRHSRRATDIAIASSVLNPSSIPTVVGGLVGKSAAQYGTRGVAGLASLVGSEAASTEIANLVTGAAQTTGIALKGAAHAGPMAAAFSATGATPQERADAFAGIVALGAAGAGLPVAAYKTRASAVRVAELVANAHMGPKGDLAPSAPTILNVPGQEALEQSHAALRSQLETTSPQDAYKGDILRKVLNAKNVPAYYVTPEQFEALVPGGAGKQGKARVNVGGKDVQLWVVENGKVAAQVHEPGHVIFDSASKADQNALLDAATPEQVADYLAEAKGKGNATPEQLNALTEEAIRKEIAVENLSLVSEGDSLLAMPLSFREKLMGVASRVVDELGLIDPYYDSGLGLDVAVGRESRGGVGTTHGPNKLSREVLAKMLKDPEVRAALDAEPVAPAPAAPAPAAPVAPAPVAPAPAAPVGTPLEAAYGKLKAGSYEKGVIDALIAKAKKGPLSPRDVENWKAVLPNVEVPGGTPQVAPQVAPQAPPQVGPAEIKPAPAPAPVKAPELPPVIQADPSLPNSKGVTASEVNKFGGLSDPDAAAGIVAHADKVIADPAASPAKKSLFQVLKDNVGKVLKMDFNAAKGVGGESAKDYQLRREEHAANPNTRELSGKLGVIVKEVRQTSGGKTVLVTWNGDAVVSNFGKIIDQVSALGKGAEVHVPYPMKDGFVIDKGEQFRKDAIQYLRNQSNGYQGGGDPLARPANMQDVFIPPVREGYVPVKLRPDPIENAKVADFINLTMGERPPATDKVMVRTPVPIRANRIADVNVRPGKKVGEYGAKYEAPVGIKGEPIKDYNPTRVALQEQGANLSKLAPVSEQINVDNILRAEPMPGVQFEPHSADVTAAGFMLSKRPRIPMELTAPDGTKVKALFDGYQDLTILGKGKIAQITPQEDLPGVPNSAKSTTYADKLQAAGYKFEIPSDKVQTDKAKTGLAFKDFFSKVTKGEFGKSNVPYEPILDLQGAEPFLAEKANHSGNFDEHIAKSIPAFLDVQIKKGNAIVQTFPEGARMLDIAASEGSFDKAITAQSGGKIKTVSLDPNADMAKFFAEKSKVEGAEYSTDAFMEGFTDGDTVVKAYNPTERFDVVHESMGFQFISPERPKQIAEAKRLMNPEGIFITEQKVRNADWAANEKLKDTEWKNKYFSKEELAAKDEKVGFQQSKQEEKAVGMVDNMVSNLDLEASLKQNFKHVTQYWDSGNFKGYVSSDSPVKLNEFVKNLNETNSKFSTAKMPREVPATEVDFMLSKTPKGKELEARGFKLERHTDPATGQIVLIARKDGIVASELSYYLKGKGTADVSMVFTSDGYKKQGLAEALYREMGADLQGMGVTKVTGTAVNEIPIRLREKVFGNVEVRPFKSASGDKFIDAGPLRSVESEIKPDAEFMLSKKPTTRTGWITPDRKFKSLDGIYHESDLAANLTDYNEKYGTNFKGINGEKDRQHAIDKGFARIRSDGNGNTTVELSPAAWSNQKRAIREHLTATKEGLNNLTLRLVNEKGLMVAEVSDNIYMAKDKNGAIAELSNELRAPAGEVAKEPTAIQRARAMRDSEADKGFMLSKKPASKAATESTVESPAPEDFDNPITLPEALKSSGWAILSATREKVGPHTAPENIAANIKLEKELKKLGYEPTAVSGEYGGKDQGTSFLATGISPAEAVRIGAKYSQESVLIPEGLAYSDGSGKLVPVNHENNVTGAKALTSGNWTRVADGPEFSMGLDWKKDVKHAYEATQKGFDKAAWDDMTVEERKAHFPEAKFFPKVKDSKGEWVADKIGSDLAGSPLVKEHGLEKAAEIVGKQFADRIRMNSNDPALQLGKTWYSRFTPVLKKFFGVDAQIFAEFLAGTSPQSQPAQNFKDALHAYQLYKRGWYDKQIKLYNEGFDGLSDGSLKAKYDAAKIKNRPANPTDATYMGWWVDKHNLVPVKEPRIGTVGKDKGQIIEPRYNTQSAAVMKIAARKWMENNGGPKTANFVRNLTGDSIEATIDLWADRSVREATYKGYVDRWRILPENAKGVTDPDFYFAQSAFRHAAKDLGWNASEVQGAMWFLEKRRWAQEGWSELNLGDYLPHLEELAKTHTKESIVKEIPKTRAEAMANVIVQRRNLIEAKKQLEDIKIQKKATEAKIKTGWRPGQEELL